MGEAELKPEMVATLVCKEMGWTYTEYLEQPAWFIDIIVKMKKTREEELAKKSKETRIY